MSERLAGGRTHMCGALRASDEGSEVVLSGWVARRRDHGGVVFLDLRDRDGVVQVVAGPAEAAEVGATASDVPLESVVRVLGTVRARPPDKVNDGIATGAIEVAASSLEVLAAAETPPFPIEDAIETEELLRLTYRYLDLRRPSMTRVLRDRAVIAGVIRRFFDERGFVDVETPALTRSTPEGARDFLVPSRLQRGKVYALPQSPQQFKQLLMVAGLDRYYQLARCFRDEDLRADRHWEFTQLDLEMSFADEEDVYEVLESMFGVLWREVAGVELPRPWPRLSYDEAMSRFGSDKPDTRYGMELVGLTEVFRGSGFRAFARAVADGGVVKAIAVPGAAGSSRSELDGLIVEATSRGARGLVWMTFSGSRVDSPVIKHLSEDERARIASLTGASDGDLVLIVADRADRVAVALDGIRRLMAERWGLVPRGRWDFVWITGFPMFEWSDDEGRWVATHHPFTAPLGDDLAPATARARAYDIVLNGVELGSGSVRIHRADLQRAVFSTLGIAPEEAEEKFGHMLRAFRYGVPPHAGFAFGLERVVMFLTGRDNIRDVIAFPKTSSGIEPLTAAPSEPSTEQLDQLGLRFRPPG